MIDLFDLLAVQRTLKSLLQHCIWKASILWSSLRYSLMHQGQPCLALPCLPASLAARAAPYPSPVLPFWLHSTPVASQAWGEVGNPEVSRPAVAHPAWAQHSLLPVSFRSCSGDQPRTQQMPQKRLCIGVWVLEASSLAHLCLGLAYLEMSQPVVSAGLGLGLEEAIAIEPNACPSAVNPCLDSCVPMSVNPLPHSVPLPQILKLLSVALFVLF